jgi:hypothetical protein
LIKNNVTALQQTVNLSFTDSFRMSVSGATGFRTRINELYGREIGAQEERVQALLNLWQGQDPATVLANLPRPLSEEGQIAWVMWTGSTQMLTPEEREMLGSQHLRSGAMRAWMGVIVIVGTGGKILPFKIAGLLFGGYGIVSGGSDMIEG